MQGKRFFSQSDKCGVCPAGRNCKKIGNKIDIKFTISIFYKFLIKILFQFLAKR